MVDFVDLSHLNCEFAEAARSCTAAYRQEDTREFAHWKQRAANLESEIELATRTTEE